MKKSIVLILFLCHITVFAQQRKAVLLQDDWQFARELPGETGTLQWETVRVPHDWAISGPFDKKWDLQTVAIEQNGEKEATEKSGRTGALPWIGKGHYKRTFSIPTGFSGYAELVFDGAMAEPIVSINGKVAGFWMYGYNTFAVDITRFIHPGENLLQVDLENLEESSRWYPGAGIYRPVTLVLTNRQHIEPWNTFIRTEKIDQHGAELLATVGCRETEQAAGMQICIELRHPNGTVVAKGHAPIVNQIAELKLNVKHPELWTPETPHLYQAVVKLMKKKETIDQITQKIGIRTVKVSKEGGFQLNGVTRKLKGVCLHHDLGPLGTAVNKAALIRQIKMMKAMGCDAIRTSHNMPSQMQMDLCDSLGMMVMAESFDMWVHPKCKNGHARFFKEWADRDITNLVKANRHHPAIVMWSIGNEIPEQWSQEGVEISTHLQNLCHQLDPTRPVTQGMDHAEDALKSGFAQVMDIPGFNYHVDKYTTNIQQLPKGFLLGSETASTVSSRGIYHFPVVPTDNSQYASYRPDYDPKAIQKRDGQCTSYDVEWCPWSNLPDDDWVMQDDYDWVIGEFVWTGYDYLGEPTPYDEYWPSRSSYFGICDLAGLPKDRYYLYRSKWQKNDHTIHLLPHWSWGTSTQEKGNRIGQVTPVYCYTDYPEGELFINGKSQGRIRKNPKERLDRYRLRWNNVIYQPGELKVVVYDENGKACGEQTLRTAGKPAQLKLDTWTQHDQPVLKADGDDLAFVTVSLTDADGNLIPDANDQLRFEVKGAGSFKAVCNGDATSLEPFTQPTMRLFSGQLVVIVQAARQQGTATLIVTDEKTGFQKETRIPVVNSFR